MVKKSSGANLATSEAAIKSTILELAASGKVKQIDCIAHITNQILELDLKQGITPSLSPKRVGLAERISICCDELFAANLIVSINDLEFSLSVRPKSC